ncbi:thiamine pyrophosphate-binding protein [Xanthobacter autotrophicus DSM 431]|uniref:thiamine pyrophosphate-binding protein n=1 Tax=Xanthobacter nonsaccharivorans TaxID=3119912 RepID=UPI00372A21A1
MHLTSTADSRTDQAVSAERIIPRRSGGRILVDALACQGVDRLFCVPGESYLDVLDSLLEHPSIRVVVTKHEGAACEMAEADAKLTGRPGICFVTRGPGAMHASIGVHVASQDSSPLILFVGQIARQDRYREAFQEVDYRAMFGSCAKWVVEIDDPARIPEHVARAFATAMEGRPGPVVVVLPEDVLGEQCATMDARPVRLSVLPDPGSHERDTLQRLLNSTQRPLVIVGGPGWSEDASKDLAGFATAWNIPVACSFRRQDLFDNRLPQYIGHLSLGMNSALATRVRAADLILAIGTRLGDVTTDGYRLLTPPTPGQRLVHVHRASSELGRLFHAELPIHASMDAIARLLTGLPAPAVAPWGEWTRAARLEQEQFGRPSDPHPDEIGVNLAQAVSHLNQVLDNDAIITNGAGNYTVWVHRYYQYRRPRTELAPTCGTMGYGLPAAVAAKLRHPDRTVVCFAGDGCFLMYPQELATAVEQEAAIVIIVVNNGMYGTIRMHQERRFPSRISATAIQGPDFVALARSFGAFAEKVERTDEFMPAFERAHASGRPALLELKTDPRQLTPQMRI